MPQQQEVKVPKGATFEVPIPQGASVGSPTNGGIQVSPILSGPTRTGTISARPIGDYPRQEYLQDVETDIRKGTTATIIGKLLKMMGAKGLESGTSKGVADFMGSPALGPVDLVRSSQEMISGHPIKATNKLISGAMKTAGPIGYGAAALAPEIALPGILAQQGVTKGASALGVGDETSELIGNISGILAGGMAAKGEMPGGKFAKELFESKVEKLQKAHAERVAAADTEFQSKLAEHKEKVQAVKDQYAQDLREYNKKAGDASTREVAAQAKTGAAVKHQQELAGLMKENLDLANKKISQSLGEEFDKVQEAVNAKNPRFNYRPVANAVAQGRAELVLPDSHRILNAMMGPEEGITGLRFDTGRTLYTKLNDYLYGKAELPMDVYKAVKGVRDALGQQLQASADSVGLGGKYSKAMRDWADYKSAWADRSALAKGGSPIVRILDSEDPGFVISQVTGKSGERLIETLGKYSKYGADSTLAGRLRGFSEYVKSLPSRAGKAPQAPVRPTFPKEPVKEPVEPFNRQEESRKILIDRIRKGAGIGGSAYIGERILRMLLGGS